MQKLINALNDFITLHLIYNAHIHIFYLSVINVNLLIKKYIINYIHTSLI